MQLDHRHEHAGRRLDRQLERQRPGGIPAIVGFCPSWPGSMTDTALAPRAVPA